MTTKKTKSAPSSKSANPPPGQTPKPNLADDVAQATLLARLILAAYLYYQHIRLTSRNPYGRILLAIIASTLIWAAVIFNLPHIGVITAFLGIFVSLSSIIAFTYRSAHTATALYLPTGAVFTLGSFNILYPIIYPRSPLISVLLPISLGAIALLITSTAIQFLRIAKPQ
jgi:hypothetical protein